MLANTVVGSGNTTALNNTLYDHIHVHVHDCNYSKILLHSYMGVGVVGFASNFVTRLLGVAAMTT